jgi:ribonuclease III
MDTYKNLGELEKKLGYSFTQQALLKEALTHRSFSNESKNSSKSNYERLEFLGDAVLELAISENLLKRFSEKNEGDLSKARSLLVREEVLVKLARILGLGAFLRLGKGEVISGGKERDSILASCLEAIIGAIHLDGGFLKALKVVEYLWEDLFGMVFSEDFDIDYKTKLQELLQAKYKKLPNYEMVRSFGPEHSKLFEVRVKSIPSIENLSGIGKSKKEAEQIAAYKAFRVLQEEGVL